MEEELATRLSHLGKDVGYMGLRMQKDVQKCLNDLTVTSDCKKFCSKLADVLKIFSEYAIQFSEDLVQRIKDFNKEEEYSDIVSKLQEISSVREVICNTCKNREKYAETSKSLGPPNNSIEESLTQVPKYELKNEILSQYSLHIDGEDGFKSEELTQAQSPSIHNNGFTNITESLSTAQEPDNSSHSSNSFHVSNANSNDDNNIPEVENRSSGTFDNNTDVVDSLGFAHSEEIQEVEDQEDVILSLSDEGDIPTLTSDQPHIDQSKDSDVDAVAMGNTVLNLENATGLNSSDTPKKSDAIPLPWKTDLEKTVQEYDGPCVESMTAPDVDKSNNSTESQKTKVISLPYKPLFEKDNSTQAITSAGADTKIEPTSISVDKAQSSSILKVETAASSHELSEPKEKEPVNIDEDVDSDVEIVSVASSQEENRKKPSEIDNGNVITLPEDDDSDIEIIEGDVIKPADRTESQFVKDDVDFDAETVKNYSQKDSNEKTVPTLTENASPLAEDGLATLSRRNSSEETVIKDANMTDLQNCDSEIGSVIETVENDSSSSNEGSERGNIGRSLPRSLNENIEKRNIWDSETVVNTPPCEADAALEGYEDSGQDAVKPSDVVTLLDFNKGDGEKSPLAVSLQNDDEVNYSEEIIAGLSPQLEVSENDSEDTIIASPVDGTALNHEDNTIQVKYPVNGSENERHSDSDDIYSKATEKLVVGNDKTDSDDFEAPTQLVLDDKVESDTCKSNETEDAVTAIDKNEDLISLTAEKTADSGGKSPECEEEQSEDATQNIEIPQNQTVPEGEDGFMGNSEIDMASHESFVFNLDDEQGSEDMAQRKSPENDENITEADSQDAKNGESDSDSQESYVFDLEKGQDDPAETPIKPKKKLKDEERKSLLKVIGEYFSKRKREKEEATQENKEENKTTPLRKRIKKMHKKKSPGNSASGKRTTKLKLDNRIKTKRRKRKSSNKSEKEVKEYSNFLSESHVDEASNSSMGSIKDNVDIQQDSSDLSDNDATQIENVDSADVSVEEKTIDQVPNTTEKQEGGPETRIVTERDKENNKDGEELFGIKVSKKPSEAPEEIVQSFSGFINQLPQKLSNHEDATNLDDGFEDLERTQQVEDLRKLRHISNPSVSNDNNSNQPEQKDSDNTSTGNKSPIREENDDGLVVSPFKRKIVRPLPDTLSDGEDALNKGSESSDSQKTNEDSQVVSPFKKKGVKRLHISDDESDSEPPKKTSEPKDSQKPDVFDCSTEEVVKSFKRVSVKRLLSTEDEQSEATQKGSDNEERGIEHETKRRKVQRLLSSDRSSPEGLDTDENQQREIVQNVIEDQGSSDESDRFVEPSQFQLDDKARDDFLEMFDQQIEDTNSSDKSSTQQDINEAGRNDDSDNEGENMAATQFKLGDCDRDNLLNLLTDKKNDEREDEGTGDGSEAINEPTKSIVDKNPVTPPSRFSLNEKAREEFLNLLNTKESGDSEDSDNADKNANGEAMSGSSDDTTTKLDGQIEASQFKLKSEDRDELLELLSSEQSDDSRVTVKQQRGKSWSKSDDNSSNDSDEEKIQCSQFKLNDKARDAFLDMLSSDQSVNSREENIGEDKVQGDDCDTDQPKDTSNDNESESKNEKGNDEAMDVDKIRNDGVADQGDSNNTISENSQGIDDVDSCMDAPDDDTLVQEDMDETIKDINQDEIEKSVAKSSEFTLDEKETSELLNLLSEHIRRTEKDSESDSTDSDVASDIENINGEHRKKRRKAEKIDKDLLLELLEEYENNVKEELNKIVKNGDKEFDHLDDDKEFSEGDFGEDSDSVILDVLREETVNLPEEGRKKRSRDSKKAAWNAYQQLLEDHDELSDTSSEMSNVDIDDIELDFSDQERRKVEQIVNAKLIKDFNIKKDLIVNVEQADISGFDMSSWPQRRRNNSSKIDRLCDISNVLQKKKKPEIKRKKAKLSPSVRSSDSSISDSDNESSSSSLNWSDDSNRSDQDSVSIRDSPFHLSNDNMEQEKLASVLWENIRNSSDENSDWSSGNGTSSSDEEEDGKRKKKNGGRGEDKKGKKVRVKKESDVKEEKSSGESTDSGKSEKEDHDDDDNDKNENGEDNRKERDVKEAELDSSDEDYFFGDRKSKGAWRLDPLLRGCLTSDEDCDSDRDTSRKRALSSIRSRKRVKRKVLLSAGAEEDDSDSEKQGMRILTQEIDNSSDSDVEFILEKKKTPEKLAVIDDETEDSPSKSGKGRRNIRALVEDDELAEATKQAKKEESERIKRLQEREKAKESFTQSQSFGSSQLSEDESDPLILDVFDDVQIKVHPKITTKLKPHQRTGIQFMWDSCYESVEQLKKGYNGSGCILAHCMGLGKTLQALGLIHTIFNYKEVTKTKHVLVVCPLSTVSNWRNEYKLAFRDIKRCNVQLYTIQGKKTPSHRLVIVKDWRRTGGILIMGYECFGQLSFDQKLDKCAKKSEKEQILTALVNPGPDLVICDEGHLLRNKQSQRTLALNKIKTRRRIVLTGTPLQNNLLEYYNMVHFVKPNLLGTEKEFKTNFVNPISNGQFENSTATDILFMKKRTHVLHKILNKTVQRVEDTELKQYLPSLVDQALFIKLSDLQVEFYNTYLDGVNARPVEYTAAGNICRKSFLADIQVLRYICFHPDTVTIAKKGVKSKIKEQDVIDDNLDEGIEDKVFSKGDWFKNLIPESGVKNPELGTKLRVALGIVEEAVANNDKTLIFSQTHAEMDCLEFFFKQEFKYKKGVDYNRMDGTISPEVRTHMCDTFNNRLNTRLKVFIMSTKVGGLGLNLTAANRVILMNVNWNPSYDTQSVFRAFRFGQDKAVYVYRLIALDTMEEKMYQKTVTKLAVAHRVVDKHQITRHYSAADIQEFYSARPTIEGDRPVPNVPEDRILAKLIQKFPFLYRWHEHQALLANRPEEDLNEQQKNAAWEEFNKKAVEPTPPGVPPPLLPQLLNVSSLLAQPGPSGLQKIVMPPIFPLVNPQTGKRRRRSSRLSKIENPLNTMSRFVVPTTLPVLIKQTPSGPTLVLQTHPLGPINRKDVSLHLGFASRAAHNASKQIYHADRPHVTMSVVDVNSGGECAPINVASNDDAAWKIQEINSLIGAHTTPELIPGFKEASTSRAFNASVVEEHRHTSRIEEINSIISASLGRDEAVSSQSWDVSRLSSPDWDNDGMNTTLLSLNLPEDDSEDADSGHFADHNYSLPKNNPLNFRTPSVDDFHPMPLPKFHNILSPLFVDVDQPLHSPTRLFRHKNPHRMYKRSIVPQRTNSADDFRSAQPKYVPRPVFVDVKSPLGPRPNLNGANPLLSQKARSSPTNNKPAQNQPSATTTTQVRLGNGVTLSTQSNSPKTNPPPAHAQKPSVSIIPQASSMRAVSNITTTKPPPFVPKSRMVQNPLNLVKAIQNASQNQTAETPGWAQKEKIQNRLRSVIGNDLTTTTKRTHISLQTNKDLTKIVTAPPKRVVVPPPRATVAPPLPPTIRPAPTPSNDSSNVIATTSTSPTPPSQQSPLQKQMRNFMEHLHLLQRSMREREGVALSTENVTGNNQENSTNISTIRTNGIDVPVTVNSAVRSVPNVPISLPARTIVRVGPPPPPLSPIIGGTSAPGRLNAARNLSNINKTYQIVQNTKSVGTLPLTPISTSQSSSPTVRVIGALPTAIEGSNTVTATSGVIVPTNGNSPKMVRKVIMNSPEGPLRSSVISQHNGASKNSVSRMNGSARKTVINPVGQTNGAVKNVGHANNGNTARVITKIRDPKSVGGKAKINPVGLINGNVTVNAVSFTKNTGVKRMAPGGSNLTTKIVPMSPRSKKIVISPKGNAQQGTAPLRNKISPIRLDLLQNKLSTTFKRISPSKLPPAPQSRFNNGANVRTYQTKKNNSPLRSDSLPSLSILRPTAPVSKSNKENRGKRKLSYRTNNTSTASLMSSIDLSNDEDNENTSNRSLSQDMVNTLKKKGVSINYLKKDKEKDVIDLD